VKAYSPRGGPSLEFPRVSEQQGYYLFSVFKRRIFSLLPFLLFRATPILQGSEKLTHEISLFFVWRALFLSLLSSCGWNGSPPRGRLFAPSRRLFFMEGLRGVYSVAIARLFLSGARVSFDEGRPLFPPPAMFVSPIGDVFALS